MNVCHSWYRKMVDHGDGALTNDTPGGGLPPARRAIPKSTKKIRRQLILVSRKAIPISFRLPAGMHALVVAVNCVSPESVAASK
jgi:hypothetical protein